MLLAASLRKPEDEAAFEQIDATPLGKYNPPRACLRAQHSARRATIPWPPQQPCRQPLHRARAGSRNVAAADRSLTPLDHIEAAWDLKTMQQRRADPVHEAASLPAGVKHALNWMKTCGDFEAWILTQLHKWTATRDALSSQTQRWRQQLSEQARAVLPTTYNGPLHEQMLHEAAYHDMQVIRDIERGFPMAGIMPDSCLFDNVPSHELPRPEQLEAALADALRRRKQTLYDMFDSMRREPEMEEVIKVTEKELKQGNFAGPWEVWRDSQGRIHSAYHSRNGCLPDAFRECSSGAVPHTRYDDQSTTAPRAASTLARALPSA